MSLQPQARTAATSGPIVDLRRLERPAAEITIHLEDLPEELAPVPAEKRRTWWIGDTRTNGHAWHCLPLTMANSLGYYVLSPGSFRVTWNGDWDEDVVVESGPGVVVDNHSAAATFTVQPGFVPRTNRVGDFVLIKGIANVRGAWFTVMEGLIEAWWQPGKFGLVCMMNRPGTFEVARGEPIAQLVVYRAEGGFATLRTSPRVPPETDEWELRRYRPGYRKDLDYMKGRHPDGRVEHTHISSWRVRKPRPT